MGVLAETTVNALHNLVGLWRTIEGEIQLWLLVMTAYKCMPASFTYISMLFSMISQPGTR